MQTGTLSRLRFCRRSWGFKIHFWRNIVRFFGSHTFVPVSWMCKKQTSVWHSSIESEIISWTLDWDWTGFPLSIYGINVLVLGNTTQNHERMGQPVTQVTRQASDLEECATFWKMLTVFPQTSYFRIKKLCCMCLRTTKQWSMRLIGCSIETIWSPKSKLSFDTKNQLADILTRGNFTRDEWNHLLCLFNIGHFSSTDCSEVMSKRTQEESGEERVTAKSRPMMSLLARAPSNLSSSTSESPGKRSYGNQNPWSATAEKEDRTGQPVVCRDTSHEQSQEIQRQNSESEQMRTFGPTKGANPRRLSGGD